MKPGNAFLLANDINTFNLTFFSSSGDTRGIEYWWKAPGGVFQPMYELFFSQYSMYPSKRNKRTTRKCA